MSKNKKRKKIRKASNIHKRRKSKKIVKKNANKNGNKNVQKNVKKNSNKNGNKNVKKKDKNEAIKTVKSATNQSKKKTHKTVITNEVFPFFARLKICKNRPTLVIDETMCDDKKRNKKVDCYVHREATHTARSKFEKVEPNPFPNDPKPMYLRPPRILSKRLFKKINNAIPVPQYLVDRYKDNNNKKKEIEDKSEK